MIADTGGCVSGDCEMTCHDETSAGRVLKIRFQDVGVVGRRHDRKRCLQGTTTKGPNEADGVTSRIRKDIAATEFCIGWIQCWSRVSLWESTVSEWRQMSTL